MSIADDLLGLILAMDSYNRDCNTGIFISDKEIGNYAHGIEIEYAVRESSFFVQAYV